MESIAWRRRGADGDDDRGRDREPDTDERAFPHDVKDAFDGAVAGAFGDMQIIILENDDPSGAGDAA